MMKALLLMAFVTILSATPLAAQDVSRVLFDFTAAEEAKRWKTVNDGVMGGRSEGKFRITPDDTLQFFGRLSLKNNGGFASVRSRTSKLDLKKGDSLRVRVRGDGRRYSFNLYVPRPLIAFSYQASFQTQKDKWVEVDIPLESFVAKSFGRVVRNQKLDPAEVNRVGILLGDKKEGAFTLEIDSIKVRPETQEEK